MMDEVRRVRVVEERLAAAGIETAVEFAPWGACLRASDGRGSVFVRWLTGSEDDHPIEQAQAWATMLREGASGFGERGTPGGA